MRLYALQILVQMLRNINKTIEAENAEFKIAQSKPRISNHCNLGEMTSVSSKRESSIDHNSHHHNNNNSDEEDNNDSQTRVESEHHT